ncbi:MAG: hypothetical protein ACK4MR_04225, partial [Erythrobacter cryptus]
MTQPHRIAQTCHVTAPSAAQGQPKADPHATLLATTLPLLGGTWQRERIVLGEAIPAAMAAGIARSGRLAITLAHCPRGETPALAAPGEGRVRLSYVPDDLATARAALVAAAG